MHPRLFAWEGAVTAFLVFNSAIGTKIVEKAVKSLVDNHTSSPERSARAEGAGHIFNYLIQVVFVTVAGGYLTAYCYMRALDDESWLVRLLLSMVIFYIMGAIPAWVKVFSDTSILRETCIYAMSWVFPQHQARTPTPRAASTIKEE